MISCIDITFPLTLYVPLVLGFLIAARYATILPAALVEICASRRLVSAGVVEVNSLGCRLASIFVGASFLMASQGSCESLACSLLNFRWHVLQLNSMRWAVAMQLKSSRLASGGRAGQWQIPRFRWDSYCDSGMIS